MKHALSLLLSAALLSSCAVMTAGVQKGDERNFVRSLNDVNAGRAIEARLKRAYDYELRGVDVEVAEGVVLLSGNVPRQEDRIEAARIAWSAPQIMQVGNEVQIAGRQGLVRNTKDGVLEKSVRARLLADKYVKGRNFNVETHDGIVYLLGVARTEAELERAARIASLTKGTKEVISYARIADLPVARQAELDSQYQSGLAAPGPVQRALPDFVTRAPLPEQDSATVPAPMRNAPMDESIPYSAPGAPVALGETIIDSAPLPPADDNAAPYYIDPDTGEQIPVKW